MSSQPDVGVLAWVGAALARFVFRAGDLVYGPWTIALLLGIGLYMTLRFMGVSVRRQA